MPAKSESLKPSASNGTLKPLAGFDACAGVAAGWMLCAGDASHATTARQIAKPKAPRSILPWYATDLPSALPERPIMRDNGTNS